MRVFLLWIPSVAVAATLCLAQSPAESSAHSSTLPDVYLVTIDTLRADHVHCYGDNQIETPALDSLARDGIRFAQAFTPSPITNTSHTSILTGLLPSVHGVTDFGIPLAKTYPTWAELLRQDGYHTAAFIGAVVLDSRTLAPGLDRGFDYYDNFPPDEPPAEHWGRVERRGKDVVHRAETWMDAHPQKQRFVWVHLYDPHDPYEPLPPYSQIYKGRLYDGEIAYADSALAQLLDYLKRNARYRNALIVVVGDHGEGLGEHNEQTHGIFLYDATTHVPLIMKLPASEVPRSRPASQAAIVVNGQVQTTDILPTVLDLLHISPPRALSGHSLSHYFSQNETGGRVVFGETDYPLRFGWSPLRAVRADGFKFIEAPRPELYDLGNDPGELKNRYEPGNPTVLDLRKKIAASPMRSLRSSPSTGTAKGTTMNELRALGYLQPGDELTTTNAPELSSLPDPKDKIEEQNLLHSAMISVDEGHASEARPLLQKVLELNPDSAAALRQLGELELNAGEYQPAANHLAQAVKVRPDDTSAALSEARALHKLGEWREARRVLEAAVQQSPEQVDARLLLAETSGKLGDHRAAEDQFEAVLLLSPQNEQALLGLSDEYLNEKRFADAIELLEPPSKDRAASNAVLQRLENSYLGAGRAADAERIRVQMKAQKQRR